jgi:hypothetical protein
MDAGTLILRLCPRISMRVRGHSQLRYRIMCVQLDRNRSRGTFHNITILAVFGCVISEGVGSGRLFLHELYLSGSAITFNLEVEGVENDGTFLLTRQRQLRR